LTDTDHEDPDRRLVQAAATGEREAFDALVRRHQVRTYNFVRTLVNDAADAEDLTQEIFVRAFRAIGRFRGDSSFRTWLFRIAVNVARTHLGRRSRWRVPWRGPRDPEDDASSMPYDSPSPEDLESDIVRRDAIDRALATLSPDLRNAVTLRDIEGLEYREIAKVLDIPIGTVESRIFRARQRLRPLLEPLMRTVVETGPAGGRDDG
jgi:RNA polymerase sigma-70 factor (ECF subfamily)